jgi:hypothetical protein
MKYLQILVILFIGCGHKPKPHARVKGIDKESIKYPKFPYIATEDDINKLISRIDRSDCVYFGRIGLAGEESEVYDCYQRLLEIAPDSVWVNLSQNKNPVIRIYAFEALKAKKSPNLREVKVRLQKDHATVCYVSADNRVIYSVGLYVEDSK